MTEFLSEMRLLAGRADELPADAAAELYALYDNMAREAAAGILEIDPELRVELCDTRDKILERVIDVDVPVKKPSAGFGIYTPAVQGYRTWSNTELMKDKCMAGYTLAKEIGGRAVSFFGTKPADYPYLAQLPGMEMNYRDTSKDAAEDYRDYLMQNSERMDALILNGFNDKTRLFLGQYKKLRPNGKVYCGLDMNKASMEVSNLSDLEIQESFRRCDIVATSCRSLRDAFNRNPNVNFSCRWLPNGFYNSTDIPIVADATAKENVILTVGRIGSGQKNNTELLLAFATALEAMPGWSLRFVGAAEPAFQNSVNQLFTAYPHMRERIILTGAITDKAELYKEYARAKIFALTSGFEGGTPNVYAEALFHGCMFITSDIDAADDITDYGTLGAKYKLGDIDILASLLASCAGADRRAFEIHIPKALAYAKKYYDWNRNAKKLAYMMFGKDGAS